MPVTYDANARAVIAYFRDLCVAMNHPLLVNVTAALQATDLNESDVVLQRQLNYIVRGPLSQVVAAFKKAMSTGAVQVGVTAVE